MKREEAIDALRNLCDAEIVSAKPTPRPTGEWEELFMDNDNPEQPSHYRCSHCKNVWNACFIPHTWAFCPHCGAEMGKGGDTK